MAKIPLLSPATRRTLAETVYFLVKDDEVQYQALLDELEHLVPNSDTDDGIFELHYFDTATDCSRALHLRTHLAIRPEQVNQIPHWIRWSEEPFEHVLPEFPLHPTFHEYSLPKIHARRPCC